MNKFTQDKNINQNTKTMNENDELKDLTPDEKLQAENELLKIKLQAEFGMKEMGSSLGKEVENEWLNYIYNFEKQFSEGKRCKVYDLLNRPEFRKADELTKEEITTELQRIEEIMLSKGIELGTICDYEDELIYRFITEELFEHETNDMQVPGMMSCFTYEEFHPNHQYDICEHADEFIEILISKKWDSYMGGILLSASVSFNDTIYTKETFQEIIEAFQANHKKLKLGKWKTELVLFDLKTETGFLEGDIKYKSITTSEVFEGEVYLEFILEYDYWSISKVVVPGFSKSDIN